MDEDIGTLIATEEAVALCVVEPLHLRLCIVPSSSLLALPRWP